MSAEDVLAELKSIGALGRPTKARPVEGRVDEVAVEEGAPEPSLVDKRGEAMVALLTDALAHVGQAIDGLEALRGDLEAVRQVWTTETLPEAENGSESLPAPVRPEDVAPAQGLQEAYEEGKELITTPRKSPGGVDLDDPVYLAAREAALRKIRGEDIPDEARKAAFEEEASVPYVGQDRAMTETGTGEMTIGTMGTIKPSFPAEEE